MTDEEHTIALEELGKVGTVKVYSQAYVDKQENRIKELESALKKITEVMPKSYKDYGYLPQARLDIIANICYEVLEK